jgi:hypothetical protein
MVGQPTRYFVVLTREIEAGLTLVLPARWPACSFPRLFHTSIIPRLPYQNQLLNCNKPSTSDRLTHPFR